MFFRLSLLMLLAASGLQAKPIESKPGSFTPQLDINRGINNLFPSNSVDEKKTIHDFDSILTGPLGIFPLAWGGRVAKDAKTWKQVGKHTSLAVLYGAFFAAFQASRTPDARLKAAGSEMEAMARLYFSGMFTSYCHSALYNYIDKGELPVWMQKSLAKAKAYRKAHPAAQQPDEAA